jgi:tRNA(Ile)-lysidine synthetase-like protein
MPDLFAPGARLVVGYSGGQDSTCLLHALAHSRRKLDIVAAHVDHGLRADSAADAQRVAHLARELGVLSVEVQRVDVAAYRRGLPGWSIQQAARAVRYQALAGIAHQHAASAVLVAHTADDQAETVLINLLRGAGLAGLAGMRMDETINLSKLGPQFTERSATVQSDRLRLARPLLRVSRSTTLAYCAELGLSIVEDMSNQSRAYTRNRVRLDLLPALERFNPAIRSVLARTADLAAEDLAALDDVVSNLQAELVRAQGQASDVLEYDLRQWRAQPRALQRRLLRLALEQLLGSLVDVRASAIDDALAILASGTPAQTYHLPHGVELCVGSRTFDLRLHGRARPRLRANTGGVEYPRV